MRVCLINPKDSTVEDPCWDEPLGLLYIAAVLERKGAVVEVLDLNFCDDWRSELRKHEADVYGVYCSSSIAKSAIEVSIFLKAMSPSSIRIVGGPHATCVPSSLERFFDMVVIGEGEKAIIESIRSKGIRTKYMYCPLIQNLDTIPFPARHLINLKKYHRRVGGQHSVGIITARGCPFGCAFCSKIWGTSVRFRSAANVLAEVRECKRKHDIHALNIRDDTFTLDTMRMTYILRGFKKMDTQFRCLTRVDQVDEMILRAMKSCGCVEIVYGIESGNQKILNNLNKGTTVEQNAKAIDLTKKVGIPVKGAFIVGSPGETWKTIEDTIRFVEEHTPDKTILCTFTPYPGSPVWEDPERFKVRILTRDVDKYQIVGPGMVGKVVMETEEMNAEDIQSAHSRVLTRFKELGLV